MNKGESVWEIADELGPSKIIHIHEPSVGLKAVLAVDNVARGPSIGGVRMAPDVSAEEAFRLARAMTFKNAAADLPHGGGKAVIYGDPGMPLAEKERVIRGFACAIRGISEYIPGPDMGTNEECMAWIKDEIGRVVGLPSVLGGIPLDELGATGFGLMACIDVARRYCDLKLEGARIVVQGFGSVGKHAARFLREKGAVLVAAADSRGTVYDPKGLDVDDLIEFKDTGKGFDEYQKAERGDRDAVIDMECEIWIPAARPDVINEGNVRRLRSRLVVAGANIAVTRPAETFLYEHGILSVPDFIANAGGVICAAMEYQNASRKVAFDAIEEKIRRNTEEVLDAARKNGTDPRSAAEKLARERVIGAMKLRRWAIF